MLPEKQRLIERLQQAIEIIESSEEDDNFDCFVLAGQKLSPLWGCTDKQAVNWNPDAIYDDGSCQYYAAIPPEE
jgi:hypothetical protein